MKLKNDTPLLVTSKKSLPNGFSAQRVTELGLGGRTLIGILPDSGGSVGGVAWVPTTVIENNFLVLPKSEKRDEKAEEHPFTPETLREQTTGAAVTAGAGGSMFFTVDLLERIGTANAAKHLAEEVIKVPAAASTVEETLISIGRSYPSFWNILKSLIFSVTLFLVVLRGLQLIYGAEVPLKAWGVAFALWLICIVTFGLWVFDYGPFASGTH